MPRKTSPISPLSHKIFSNTLFSNTILSNKAFSSRINAHHDFFTVGSLLLMAFVSAFLFNFTHSIANTFANHCAHSVIQCDDASYFHPPKDVPLIHTGYAHTLSLNTLTLHTLLVQKHRVQDIARDSVTLEIVTLIKGTSAIATSEADKLELIALSMRGAEPELFKSPFILLYTGSCYTSES